MCSKDIEPIVCLCTLDCRNLRRSTANDCGLRRPRNSDALNEIEKRIIRRSSHTSNSHGSSAIHGCHRHAGHGGCEGFACQSSTTSAASELLPSGYGPESWKPCECEVCVWIRQRARTVSRDTTIPCCMSGWVHSASLISAAKEVLWSAIFLFSAESKYSQYIPTYLGR